jgi:BirA family biotin operon repressor/biotin-[acetyl-CoA-carboxylase] ligase
MGISWRIDWFDIVTSTHHIAQDYLHNIEDPSGVVIVASQQTQGRGQYGRSWISDQGNLFMSCILPHDHFRAEHHMPLSLHIAGILQKCLKKNFVPDGNLTIKVPNDLLIEGEKVCGILVEQNKSHNILGIGLNIKHCPQGGSLSYPATFLQKHTIMDLTPQIVLQKILDDLKDG